MYITDLHYCILPIYTIYRAKLNPKVKSIKSFFIIFFRSELRKRDAVAIHNRSGGGSPRPKRRSPRIAGGSPASPAGSTRDGSLYGSPLSSPTVGSPMGGPSLQEEVLRRGRGPARKVGVGSASPRRPIHERATIRDESTVDDNVKNICLVAIVVVALGVLLFVLKPFHNAVPVKSEAPSQSRREVILENLMSELRDLRAKFPEQERRFWSVIGAATKRVVQDEHPSQPAVLMLVAPPAGSSPSPHTGNSPSPDTDITDCLATHITEAVKRAHNNSKALKVNLHEFATTTGKGVRCAKARTG